MTVPESAVIRRRSWPSDYYSTPTPPAVFPSWVSYGCGAISLLILGVIFAGGAWLSSGGFIDAMDFTIGMSMGELRGMYTDGVTADRKKSLDASVAAMRKNFREK